MDCFFAAKASFAAGSVKIINNSDSEEYTDCADTASFSEHSSFGGGSSSNNEKEISPRSKQSMSHKRILRAKGIIELIPCIQNSPNISLPSKLN
jgi:hypothetical protein